MFDQLGEGKRMARNPGASRPLGLAVLGLVTLPVWAAEQGSARRIEDVVITAERTQSTVQDTAISITAFNEEFIEDLGLRNQEDLANYIPAATIEPYDIAIRGVGRLFRALGGDPGVATYLNGAYSEDFFFASTEGGLYDIARVEVLRGPQGTLYGRNGVGGAVNFHNNKPNNEFSGETRVLLGDYATREYYGYLNVPLLDDTLAGRFNGTKRSRSGYVNDIGGSAATGNLGDESYSAAFLFTPRDDMEFYLRGTTRSSKRIMSSAQGAGLVVTSENGGMGDPITGARRNNTSRVFGYRVLETLVDGVRVSDASAPCASFTSRAVGNCTILPAQIPAGQLAEYDPTIYTYSQVVPDTSGAVNISSIVTNPMTMAQGNVPRLVQPGQVITRRVQRVVPGIDPIRTVGNGGALGNVDATARPNFLFGHDTAAINAGYFGSGRDVPDDVDGDDLRADTQGVNDEDVSYSNVVLNAKWDLTDWLTVKYVGAYTDYIYKRTTDDDRSSNTFGTGDIALDMQFYVNQEGENYQHEVTGEFKFSENLTLTTGLFYFHTNIDQRLDFYSSTLPRYTQGAYYDATFNGGFGALNGLVGFNPANPMADWNSARDRGTNASPALGQAFLTGDRVTEVRIYRSLWQGDVNNSVPSGKNTNGTSFIWNTRNETEAFAVFAQGTWNITDAFALTVGGRWAKDDKIGEENLFQYQENPLSAANLLAYNIASGALNADGTPTVAGAGEVTPIRFLGVPFAQSLYRKIEKEFEEATWRVNLDWKPTEESLVYVSATSGYRSGGFNLGFFSSVPHYDPESIFAYELGYKGQFFDGTVQLNASTFLYVYDDIHIQIAVESGAGISTAVVNGPEAQSIGFEAELVWLPIDGLTVGATYSITDTEYQDDVADPVTGQLGIVDNNQPSLPSSVFEVDLRRSSIDGEPLQRVPEQKYNLYAMYTVPLEEYGAITFQAVYAWTDDVLFDENEDPLDLLSAYARLDLGANWTSADEAWEARVFVNNVLDEIGYRNRDAENESQQWLRTVEPTNPRTIGLDVRYRFGAN
jgi:outer membrane receptor protein involved in Fe transport